MPRKINVFERPKNQRYWVVRAKGGRYIQHFRQAGVIAIGHLDNLNILEKENDPYLPNIEDLEKRIIRSETKKDKKRGSFRAKMKFNQIKSFLNEMSIGDLVITIDSGFLMIGRITGYPRIDQTPVKVIFDEEKDRYTEMDFALRRNVNWGPFMKRDSLPTAMKRSISAKHTVFNVDKFWTAIYHLLYPVFIFENNLYLSIKINQKSDVSNYSVSKVFQILTDLEVLARSADLLEDTKQEVDFDALFAQFLEDDDFRLATTAEFMSPGSIWSYIGLKDQTGKAMILGMLLYGAMFGVEIGSSEYGSLKIDGIVTKEMREKILEKYLSRLDDHDAEKIKKKLDLTIPNFDTKPLEDSKQDSPPYTIV